MDAETKPKIFFSRLSSIPEHGVPETTFSSDNTGAPHKARIRVYAIYVLYANEVSGFGLHSFQSQHGIRVLDAMRQLLVFIGVGVSHIDQQR